MSDKIKDQETNTKTKNEPQSISTILKTMGFEPPKEVGQEKCDGCGEQVKLMEMRIIGGENKGKKQVFKQGCICEELEMQRKAAELKKRQKQHKTMAIFDMNSMINDKLKHCTFDNFEPKTEEQKKAIALAKEWADAILTDGAEPFNLLFSGLYGVGKSHLAMAAIKDLLNKNVSCAFVTVPKLLRKIRSTYGNNASKEAISEDDIMSGLEAIDVLVLDDIGAEKDSDWTQEKLFEVVDARAGKPTFYTTNLNAEELNNKIGARNFSRLMQDTTPMRVKGGDYRLKEF